MCWTRITHYMAHDARPLMASKLEGNNTIFVDPYRDPRPCKADACPGHLEESSQGKKKAAATKPTVPCDVHRCCEVVFEDFYCQCCAKPKDNDPSNCKHAVDYHVYEHSLRAAPWDKISKKKAATEWVNYPSPDADLLFHGVAPKETRSFVAARRHVYANGRRLLAERLTDEDAAAAKRSAASFNESVELMILLEQDKQGFSDCKFMMDMRKAAGIERPLTDEVANAARAFDKFKEEMETVPVRSCPVGYD